LRLYSATREPFTIQYFLPPADGGGYKSRVGTKTDNYDVVDISATCGDGIVNGDEECDGGIGAGPVETADCNIDCSFSVCGDTILNQTDGEECDNGNTDPLDGCNATCLDEYCGDGITQDDEECDDGNTEPGDGCDESCLSEEVAVIPTMNEWGMMIFMLLAGAGALYYLRRRDITG
jgi:cysteine-rich repeat protein